MEDASCAFSGSHLESATHLFVVCDLAFRVWYEALRWLRWKLAISANLLSFFLDLSFDCLGASRVRFSVLRIWWIRLLSPRGNCFWVRLRRFLVTSISGGQNISLFILRSPLVFDVVHVGVFVLVFRLVCLYLFCCCFFFFFALVSLCIGLKYPL